VKLARGIEDRFVAVPIAAPLFVVARSFEKIFFGNLAGHPLIENFLAPRKHRLDGDRDTNAFGCQVPNELRRIRLASLQCVIVANPNQIGFRCSFENEVGIANRLEGLELTIEFLDIFPAGGCIQLADITLDAPDGSPFQVGDLPKSLL
jgi:hypothetical protein